MKHHHLSQFLLRGFCDAYPKKKGKIYELDLWTLKQKGPCAPKDFAYVEDLYRQDIPGEDPHAHEAFFASNVESKTAPVFFSMFKTKKLPVGEDRANLLFFIATSATRIPLIRDLIESSVNHDFRDGLLAHTQTSEGFEDFLAQTPVAVPEELIERVRLLIRSSMLKGRMSNNVFLAESLRASSETLRFLSTRFLRLAVCESEAPDLVCPDWPVRFIPSPGSVHCPDIDERLADSVLPFRINRRMLLFVGPDGPDLERPLSTEEALAINRIAVSSPFGAYRYVYSSTPDFQFMGDGGVVWTPDNLRKRRRAHAVSSESVREVG